VHSPAARPLGYNLDSKTGWALGGTLGYRVSTRFAILLSLHNYGTQSTVLEEPFAADPSGPNSEITGVAIQRGTYQQIEVDLAVEYDLRWQGVFLTAGRRVLAYRYEAQLSYLWNYPTGPQEHPNLSWETTCGEMMHMVGAGISRPLTRFGNLVTVLSYSFPRVSKGLQIRTGFRLKL
jgi:hypothetical protein